MPGSDDYKLVKGYFQMKVRAQPMEGRRASDEGVVGGEKKLKEAKKDKEHRAKAKVYQSKGRSTGIV